MFAYPSKALYGRVLPKTKIFEKAGVTSAQRKRFAAQWEKVVWEYKLAPDTVNLAEGEGVQEIQIMTVTLKTAESDFDLLRCLDNAIAHPLFFELIHGKRRRLVAAFKRSHETISDAGVVGEYFSSPWVSESTERKPLPLALNLRGLYEAMLRTLMLPAREGESLREQTERLARFQVAQREMRQLEAKLRHEKSFAKKVDLERELRSLRKAWSAELAADQG